MAVKLSIQHLVLLTLFLYSSFPAQVVVAQNSTINTDVTTSSPVTSDGIPVEGLPLGTPSDNQTETIQSSSAQNDTKITTETFLSDNQTESSSENPPELSTGSFVTEADLTTESILNTSTTVIPVPESNESNQTTETEVPIDKQVLDNVSTTDGPPESVTLFNDSENVTDRMITDGLTEPAIIEPTNSNQTNTTMNDNSTVIPQNVSQVDIQTTPTISNASESNNKTDEGLVNQNRTTGTEEMVTIEDVTSGYNQTASSDVGSTQESPTSSIEITIPSETNETISTESQVNSTVTESMAVTNISQTVTDPSFIQNETNTDSENVTSPDNNITTAETPTTERLLVNDTILLGNVTNFPSSVEVTTTPTSVENVTGPGTKNGTVTDGFDNFTTEPNLELNNFTSISNATNDSVTLPQSFIQNTTSEDFTTPVPHLNQSELTGTVENITSLSPTSLSNITADNSTEFTPVASGNVTPVTSTENGTETYGNVTESSFFNRTATHSNLTTSSFTSTQSPIFNETFPAENTGNVTQEFNASTTEIMSNASLNATATESPISNTTGTTNIADNVSSLENFTSAMNATESAENTTTFSLMNTTLGNVTVEITTVSPGNVTENNGTEVTFLVNSTGQSVTTETPFNVTVEDHTEYNSTTDYNQTLQYNVTEYDVSDSTQSANVSTVENVTEFSTLEHVTDTNETVSNFTSYENVTAPTNFNVSSENTTEQTPVEDMTTNNITEYPSNFTSYDNVTTSPYGNVTPENVTSVTIFENATIANNTEFMSNVTFQENTTAPLYNNFTFENVTEQTVYENSTNLENITMPTTLTGESSSDITSNVTSQENTTTPFFGNFTFGNVTEQTTWENVTYFQNVTMNSNITFETVTNQPIFENVTDVAANDTFDRNFTTSVSSNFTFDNITQQTTFDNVTSDNLTETSTSSYSNETSASNFTTGNVTQSPTFENTTEYTSNITSFDDVTQQTTFNNVTSDNMTETSTSSYSNETSAMESNFTIGNVTESPTFENTTEYTSNITSFDDVSQQTTFNNVTSDNMTETSTSSYSNETSAMESNFTIGNVTKSPTFENTTEYTSNITSFDDVTQQTKFNNVTSDNMTETSTSSYSNETSAMESNFTTGNVTESPTFENTTEYTSNITSFDDVTQQTTFDNVTSDNLTETSTSSYSNETSASNFTIGNVTESPTFENTTEFTSNVTSFDNVTQTAFDNVTSDNMTETSNSSYSNETSATESNFTIGNVTESPTFENTTEFTSNVTYSENVTTPVYSNFTSGNLTEQSEFENVTNSTYSGITSENVTGSYFENVTSDNVTQVTLVSNFTDSGYTTGPTVSNFTEELISTLPPLNDTSETYENLTSEEVTVNVNVTTVFPGNFSEQTSESSSFENGTTQMVPINTTDNVTAETSTIGFNLTDTITLEPVTNVTESVVTTGDDFRNVTTDIVTQDDLTTESFNVTTPPTVTTEDKLNETLIVTAEDTTAATEQITTESVTEGVTTQGPTDQVTSPEPEVTSQVDITTESTTQQPPQTTSEEVVSDVTTAEEPATTQPTTAVEIVTTDEIVTTEESTATTDSAQVPSTTPVPPTVLPNDIINNLLTMTIKPRWGDDLNSDEVKKKYEEGLLHSYLVALFGANVNRRKRALPPNPDNLQAKVTSVESNKDGTADVNFYMSGGDGSVVPADTATAVYNRLHPADVSAYLGAQVTALPQPVIAEAPPTTKDDDGMSPALIVAIILGVLVLLCVVAIVILCYRDTHRKSDLQDIHMHNYHDVRKDYLPPYSVSGSMEAGQLQSPPQSVIVNGLPVEVTRERPRTPSCPANEADTLRAEKLSKKLAKYGQMPDDEKSLPRIVGYKNRAYEVDESALVHVRATTSARKPKDEDSLSVTERSLDVQPRNRIPKSKQKLRGQGRKHSKGHSEVTEVETSVQSADYDTQSVSSMESTHSAGMFEHVAKMSRITEPKLAGPAMPPVRFRPTIQPFDDLSSMPPLRNSVIQNDTETAATSSDSEFERKKHKSDIPPVKLRSNVTGSRQRHNSMTSSESILDQADRERHRNKQRQRDLEKQHEKENGTITSHPDDRERKKKEKKKRKERKERNDEYPQDDLVDATADKRRSSKSPSPAARKLQESRDKRWKKSPKVSSESHHESSKPGRNMRAAPRRSSSARSSEVGDISRQARHQLLPHKVGPLKQKRRKRHTFSYPPGYHNLNDYSPASTMSLDSSIPPISETDHERSISPNQIHFQLAAMPRTDVQNSYHNPRVAAVPREWVLPAQMPYGNIRAAPRAVRPTVVVPRPRPRPRHSALSYGGTPSAQPTVLVGSNGRYYQQIPRYGASNSPPQKDKNNQSNSALHLPVSMGIRPQASPVMSTIQENNQTTHFMVPPNGQYGPSGNGLGMRPALINNYPALNPIYTMIENAREETPPTNRNAVVNHVQAYQVPTSLPVTNVPPIPPRASDFQREISQIDSLEREVRRYNDIVASTPVTQQPQNPPDIISVLANPKAAQTPIATISGSIDNVMQPSVYKTPGKIQASGSKFEPSGNGAFKPPPQRVRNNFGTEVSGGPKEISPSSAPSSSQSIWSSALDNKKRCSPPDKSRDLKSGRADDSDNSSLEDFANELGNTSFDSENGDITSATSQQAEQLPYNVEMRIKNPRKDSANHTVVKDTPPVPPRKRNSVPKNASVVDQTKRDPTKQELMEQLALQQAVHDQQQQLRQTAQQLINEAYKQQEDNSRVKRDLDSQQAKRLLSDAFPLARNGHSVPTSPPSHSTDSHPSAAHSESHGAPRPRARKSKQKTALEKLLSEGSLSGLPPHGHRMSTTSLDGASAQSNHRPAPNTLNRNAWEGTASPRSAASQDAKVRSAAEVISRNLNNMSPQDKTMLLQAIRTELQAMQPPSAED